MPTNTGQQIAGAAVNMGIGRGLGELGLRSPIPLPSFYNAASADHFRDSQAGRMLRGDRRAWVGYGRNVVDRAIGGAIAGPIGAAVAPWADRHLIMPTWNAIRNAFNHSDTPHGEVTVGQLNDTSGFDNQQIDPWTGQSIIMPSFSNYGPYSSGYQGLGAAPSIDYPEFPDYNAPEGPEYEGPYSPEHYGFEGPSTTMPSGFSYSQAGGGSGAGVWNGGGGMHSYTVNSGSLSPSNYSGISGGGIARGKGRENGTSQN